MSHAPCPICHDPYTGFHEEDCGASVTVPRDLVIPPKPETTRIRLTPEEIARLRAESAARRGLA